MVDIKQKQQSGYIILTKDGNEINQHLLSISLGEKFNQEFGEYVSEFISSNNLYEWLNKQEGITYFDKITPSEDIINEDNITQYNVQQINSFDDLPPYGKFVLVSGIDKKLYDIRRWHVCEMNDLEDGVEFKENGFFYWLTEAGDKIEDVTCWCNLPN